VKTKETFNFLRRIAIPGGLMAMWAASIQAQYVPALNALEASKTWTLSADARGFYDDNYLTEPKSFPSPAGTGSAHPKASWGTDLAPSAAFKHSGESTLIAASYNFDARWYEEHSPMDLTHQFDGRFEHEFGEHYKLSASESFVIAQEPTVIDPDIVTAPFRIPGGNIRNTGQVGFTGSLGRSFDLHLGYGNTVYAYQQIERSVIGYGLNGTGGTGYEGPYLPEPSQSDRSDRMEQLAAVDLRWKAGTKTTLLLGYQYGHTDYTSPQYIIFPAPPYNGPTTPVGYTSNIRNSDAHYVFAGVEENFTADLKASLRAGGEYLDYYNFGTSRLSPYINAKITYHYLPGDVAELGVKHVHNSTDVVGASAPTPGFFLGPPATTQVPVLDEETTAVYLSEKHNFSSKFAVTLTGQAQDSAFVGGATGFNGIGEDFFVVQLNLAYQFTPWVLAETGYNYSRLTSNLALGEYTRNFGYLGFRATW
jgi:hypothetical protein